MLKWVMTNILPGQMLLRYRDESNAVLFAFFPNKNCIIFYLKYFYRQIFFQKYFYTNYILFPRLSKTIITKFDLFYFKVTYIMDVRTFSTLTISLSWLSPGFMNLSGIFCVQQTVAVHRRAWIIEATGSTKCFIFYFRPSGIPIVILLIILEFYIYNLYQLSTTLNIEISVI